VQSIPVGVYYTMISDSCHFGGLLESAREAFGNSYQFGDNAGGFAAYPPAPSNLLDLPPRSGRDLGFFLSACQSDQVLAKLFEHNINYLSMAFFMRNEYFKMGPDQVLGLFCSVHQESLQFLRYHPLKIGSCSCHSIKFSTLNIILRTEDLKE